MEGAAAGSEYGRVKVGCCGFPMARAEYSRRFPVVEIQQSFYNQCPARFTPASEHLENLRAFFRSVDRSGLVIAWEPQGDWASALVGELCRELDLVHVVDPLAQLPQSAGPRYFRLHGVTENRYLHTHQHEVARGSARGCLRRLESNDGWTPGPD